MSREYIYINHGTMKVNVPLAVARRWKSEGVCTHRDSGSSDNQDDPLKAHETALHRKGLHFSWQIEEFQKSQKEVRAAININVKIEAYHDKCSQVAAKAKEVQARPSAVEPGFFARLFSGWCIGDRPKGENGPAVLANMTEERDQMLRALPQGWRDQEQAFTAKGGGWYTQEDKRLGQAITAEQNKERAFRDNAATYRKNEVKAIEAYILDGFVPTVDVEQRITKISQGVNEFEIQRNQRVGQGATPLPTARSARG
jgi:hypothetical protein